MSLQEAVTNQLLSELHLAADDSQALASKQLQSELSLAANGTRALSPSTDSVLESDMDDNTTTPRAGTPANPAPMTPSPAPPALDLTAPLAAPAATPTIAGSSAAQTGEISAQPAANVAPVVRAAAPNGGARGLNNRRTIQQWFALSDDEDQAQPASARGGNNGGWTSSEEESVAGPVEQVARPSNYRPATVEEEQDYDRFVYAGGPNLPEEPVLNSDFEDDHDHYVPINYPIAPLKEPEVREKPLKYPFNHPIFKTKGYFLARCTGRITKIITKPRIQGVFENKDVYIAMDRYGYSQVKAPGEHNAFPRGLKVGTLVSCDSCEPTEGMECPDAYAVRIEKEPEVPKEEENAGEGSTTAQQGEEGEEEEAEEDEVEEIPAAGPVLRGRKPRAKAKAKGKEKETVVDEEEPSAEPPVAPKRGQQSGKKGKKARAKANKAKGKEKA